MFKTFFLFFHVLKRFNVFEIFSPTFVLHPRVKSTQPTDQHELLNGETISNVAVDHAFNRFNELYRHLMCHVAEQIRHLDRRTKSLTHLHTCLLFYRSRHG